MTYRINKYCDCVGGRAPDTAGGCAHCHKPFRPQMPLTWSDRT